MVLQTKKIPVKKIAGHCHFVVCQVFHEWQSVLMTTSPASLASKFVYLKVVRVIIHSTQVIFHLACENDRCNLFLKSIWCKMGHKQLFSLHILIFCAYLPTQ